VSDSPSPAPGTDSPESHEVAGVDPRRHLRIGWWMLLISLSLGIVLESLHGFKVGWYLDVTNETRRLLWTLAHAHGTLLGLLHIAFAATLGVGGLSSWRCRLTSVCLIAAGVLLPGGFFLGGFGIQGGDPGLGILLVPAGAAALLCGVLLMAIALTIRR